MIEKIDKYLVESSPNTKKLEKVMGDYHRAKNNIYKKYVKIADSIIDNMNTGDELNYMVNMLDFNDEFEGEISSILGNRAYRIGFEDYEGEM